MKNRLLEFIKYKGLTVNAFEKAAGLSNGFVNKVGENLQLSSLRKIRLAFPELDYNWLRGADVPMIEGNELDNKSNASPSGIPMYDSVASASQVEVYTDGGDLTPKFRVSIPQFADCEFGKMIFGHSMEPTLANGTYVFCKRIEDKRSIVPGEVYYVEWGSYSLVKRLQLGDKPGEVLAESDNNELRADGRRRFEAFPIPLDEIRGLFLVKGSFQQTQN